MHLGHLLPWLFSSAVWRSSRMEYQWSMADSRPKDLDFGWAAFESASCIDKQCIALISWSRSYNRASCQDHVIYRVSSCPAADSSGSHCTKWAGDQHRPAGLELWLITDLPSLNPHYKPISCRWPCVKSCLAGGSDKQRT